MRLVVRQVIGVAIGAGLSLSATAATLYKWVDEQGNIVYQDTPPASDVPYEEQSIADSEDDLDQAAQIAHAVAASPVTLYAIADCDSCDVVRIVLQKRGVPFSEEDAGTDIAIQQELMAKAGRLEVPTVTIGDQILVGYSRQPLHDALDAAGYPGAGSAPSAPPGTGAVGDGLPAAAGDRPAGELSGALQPGAPLPALLEEERFGEERFEQQPFDRPYDALEQDIGELSDDDAAAFDEQIEDLKSELDD
jgi:glutaredoxin